MFGTHFIDILPFGEYHSAFKYFFQSLPKHAEQITILDAACGNENRVLAGMKRYGRPISLTSTDIVAPSEFGGAPENVSRDFSISDLRNRWRYPDNSFDGVIFAWALHWFGLDGSQTALDNTARVLKPGASAIISTLTPFDVLLKNHVFLREKIGKSALLDIYPHASIIKGQKKWTVRNDIDIRSQLKSGQGYILKKKPPLKCHWRKRFNRIYSPIFES